MNDENGAIALEEEDTSPAELEARGISVWHGLLVAALIILVFGTSHVLGMNAERDAQTERVRAAQSQMEVLPAAP